jgi:hypothetical protein
MDRKVARHPQVGRVCAPSRETPSHCRRGDLHSGSAAAPLRAGKRLAEVAHVLLDTLVTRAGRSISQSQFALYPRCDGALGGSPSCRPHRMAGCASMAQRERGRQRRDHRGYRSWLRNTHYRAGTSLHAPVLSGQRQTNRSSICRARIGRSERGHGPQSGWRAKPMTPVDIRSRAECHDCIG